MELIVVFPFVAFYFWDKGKQKKLSIHNLKCNGRKLNEKYDYKVYKGTAKM